MPRLIDTQTLSVWLRVERARSKGVQPNAKELEVVQRLMAEDPLYISVATRFEVERGLLATGSSRSVLAFLRFLGETIVLSAEVAANEAGGAAWAQAARTWATSRTAGYTPNSDADTLIVATAQVYGLTLVTHDGGMKLVANAQDPPVIVEDWLA